MSTVVRKRGVAVQAAPFPLRCAPARPPTPFGQKLRQARLDQELTQPAVAKKARISQGHLFRLETGRVNPSPAVLLRLEKVLGVELRSVAPAKPASPSAAGLEERMRRWVEKWGLDQLKQPRIAAITPEILRQEPRLQALLGRPLFLGQAAVVIVPSEPDSIGNTVAGLMEHFSGQQGTVIQPYGYRGDPALDLFERYARTPAAGFTVLERIPLNPRGVLYTFQRLAANLAGVNPERIDLEDVARFLAEIMA